MKKRINIPKKYARGNNDCIRQCVALMVGRKRLKVPHFVALYGCKWMSGLDRWCCRTGHALVYADCKSRGRNIPIRTSGKTKMCLMGKDRRGDGHAILIDHKGKVIWDGGTPLKKIEEFFVVVKVAQKGCKCRG